MNVPPVYAPEKARDRTCARCRPGFFKSTAGDEACKQWSACPIGQGETQPGSSSTDRECSPCTLGADFSPVNSGGPCQAVSKACPAGEYRSVEATLSSDRICTACLPGYFKSAQGNEACMLWRTCPRGQGQTSTGTAVADRSCAAFFTRVLLQDPEGAQNRALMAHDAKLARKQCKEVSSASQQIFSHRIDL